MQREKLQSTALTGGLSLMAATCETIDSTTLAILTSASPIDFRGPGRRQIDLFITVVAPASKRQEQLWILSRFAQMALRSDFLHKLRESNNADELSMVISSLIDDN
jgi:mannitol/fructose-specific phosphotransferase system IIA component (Ntr-type)